ncbi:hypothetical protein D3C72_1692720 [compost metagenome]
MVRTDAPADAARGDIRLDLLVEFEVILLRQDVDLGAGRLFPFRDPLIELFVLLSADQLGVDGDAFELAGQFRGIGRSHCAGKHDDSGRNAGKQPVHNLSSTEARPHPGAHFSFVRN